MNENYIKLWKRELSILLKSQFSKNLVHDCLANIDNIEEMIKCSDASLILSFIHFMLLSKDVDTEEKEETLRDVSHVLISSLCVSMMPITYDNTIDNIFAKHRDNMYKEIALAINNNWTQAKEEIETLNEKLGSSIVSEPSTSIH